MGRDQPAKIEQVDLFGDTTDDNTATSTRLDYKPVAKLETLFPKERRPVGKGNGHKRKEF